MWNLLLVSGGVTCTKESTAKRLNRVPVWAYFLPQQKIETRHRFYFDAREKEIETLPDMGDVSSFEALINEW